VAETVAALALAAAGVFLWHRRRSRRPRAQELLSKPLLAVGVGAEGAEMLDVTLETGTSTLDTGGDWGHTGGGGGGSTRTTPAEVTEEEAEYHKVTGAPINVVAKRQCVRQWTAGEEGSVREVRATCKPAVHSAAAAAL
jgi:hypothetical protein